VPLMISNGPRMLRIALPHVDAWNTWYEDYGNSAEGLAALVERIGIPATVSRSACVLVGLEGGERVATAPPVERGRVAAHLRELAEAGADEAILVVDPIDERSIRELGEVVAPANGGH
jgi:hypothetical protein